MTRDEVLAHIEAAISKAHTAHGTLVDGEWELWMSANTAAVLRLPSLDYFGYEIAINELPDGVVVLRRREVLPFMDEGA